MRTLVAALALVLSGCATDLRLSAHQAVTADLATTAYGITSGLAVEANPFLPHPALIALGGVARYVVIENYSKSPEPARTTGLAGVNAITWGIVASNLTVLTTGLNPLGIVIGLVTGYNVWRSTEDERNEAQLCAIIRLSDPKDNCEFKD
jgi:hypothetical protein